MIIIITGVTYDRDGYKFWNGSENVTADLRELMHDAKAGIQSDPTGNDNVSMNLDP